MYLAFSDAAKFADIARNLVNGLGYVSSFSFFGGQLFTATWVSPLMPFSIALFFKLFGVGDVAVIATSFFYFFLLIIFSYLLGKKIYGSLVGVLAGIAVGFNIDFIKYAQQGASEPLFMFEIIAASYFITLKKRWATVGGAILMVAMYFTRPQAFIYIAGLILYHLLLNYKFKKAASIFIGTLLIGYLIDSKILPLYAGKHFLYSVTVRGLSIVQNEVAGSAVSDSLRGIALETGQEATNLFKKVFYNIYNFYKLLPQIINPYLVTLFLLGVIKWGKDKFQNSFKITSMFIAGTTALVAAASIPFFRYLHPVVPFVYIIALGTLVELISKIEILNSKKIFIILASVFLIVFFSVGQTVGVLVLDSRFERNTHNVGKPPVYVTLSKILKENTSPNDVVVTNLDTWGSWYGERKTVWFPLEPSMIEDGSFDAIYLTSYLIDDENYYMGESWRKIYNDPKNQTILKDYKYLGEYDIPSSETYERKPAHSVLLIKK